MAKDGVQVAKALESGGTMRDLEFHFNRPKSTLYTWKQRAVRELADTEYGRNVGLTTSPTPPIRYCDQCGEPLPADSTKRKKYCGGTCRVTALRARRKAAA
jgi:hypothetical protein